MQEMERVHASYVLGLSGSRDGMYVASASGDRTVGVWRCLPLTAFERVSLCCGGTWVAVASLFRSLFEGDEDEDD